ncbi:MAG: YdbL family protein [Betaproteobacteria bacterium]
MSIGQNGFSRALLIVVLATAACLSTGCSTLMAPLNALQPEVKFETDTPTVVAIRKSLALRYAQLQPQFEAGVIGFTQDGMIALRDGSGLTLVAEGEMRMLIAEDNKERGALYREMARANGRPDWEMQFRYTFSERWISRAPVGWYYRDGSGKWIRKVLPAPAPSTS